MTISSLNSNAYTPVRPSASQNTAKPQATAPKDADGDSDGDSGAQAAAEQRGGIDVKG